MRRSKRHHRDPVQEAIHYISLSADRPELTARYINSLKGRGVFSHSFFEKGDFLVEYRGEIISFEECQRRRRIYHDALQVYFFEYKVNGNKHCIDAAKDDLSLGRLVNDDHINPNSQMKRITVKGKPHLCLFAIRQIQPGEEITYNYGDMDWPWRTKWA
ncbi:histone-lysine N-methyltransferase set-1-like [Clupea harengus]|uniref:Histone-lysine N-methyltransferase set-1-like n=1 Tax=Clupea harengus TaxID=7950 RepID=A0A8M1KHN6_CLUHA|nr:histone-lysine N-methyltransferase set-1-like [Clupea harengus]